MTRIEIEKRIETLENCIFMIHMVDRWTMEDRNLLKKHEKELEELRKKLEKK